MSLLLGADMIPLNIKIFLRNQSEKPMLYKTIRDMKNSINISEKTIQIADKSLNTANNIIESIESRYEYIFGKSIKKMSSEDRNKLLKDLDFDILKSYKLGEIDIANRENFQKSSFRLRIFILW
ncbi:Uncharacterised protein [Mycoplasmopsis edwardii]|uniref:Uncharacterized protein n=1 Tax=Mycoplasmopsis edwardii TaxID=53558 RepID=A0A3B0PL65_9BACT|nr:hypothetical protein [Mycoplasmopsis edwardii]SYV97399.1 Uncharacterised protein [Mycoplasmopsis edwardii]